MDNWISLDANNSIPLFINASFIIVCQSLHCPYTLSARAQNRNSRPTNLMFHPNIFRFHSHKLILFAHLIASCPFMRVSAVVGSPCLVRFSGISVYKMARRISQFSWNVPFKQPFSSAIRVAILLIQVFAFLACVGSLRCSSMRD